jgi:hypothetical protein
MFSILKPPSMIISHISEEEAEWLKSEGIPFVKIGGWKGKEVVVQFDTKYDHDHAIEVAKERCALKSIAEL